MSTADSTVNYDTPARYSDWRVDVRQSGPRLWISQTWSLLADAYRDLNSRKMFWITLILSGLVAGVFALVGFGPSGVSLAGWDLFAFPTSDIVSPRDFYVNLFLELGVGIWITWAATILAIISTAGIVPDLVTGGSIDLYLSKPLGRTRLFLTKYVTGLLFVAMQIAVFALACFLVIGFRANAWAWAIFLVVPVVTVYYSFLFCVCALVGMLSRSALAAILVTLLFWLVLFILNASDTVLLIRRTVFELNVAGQQAQLERDRATLAAFEQRDRPISPIRVRGIERQIATGEDNLRKSQDLVERISWWHDLVLAIKTPLPKTGETISTLERILVESEELSPRQAATPRSPLIELSDLDEDDFDEESDDGEEDGEDDSETTATTQPETQDATLDEGSSLNDAERRELERLRRADRARQRNSQFEAALNSPEFEQTVQANYINRSVLWSWGTSLGFE
ncbi:MAG: ABC transporter permease, partial [Planctomycetota bacterium]